MHLTRAEITRKVPIARKGTKYVARARENYTSAIPLVVAIRDILHLAKTAKEVNEMIKNKSLKINGRVCIDYRESIKLFGILEADKKYVMTILSNGRFSLEQTKEDARLCKVIGKKIVDGGKVQINLHDGGNFITKDKIVVGDSVHVKDGKIVSHMKMEKGKKVLIISGRSVGKTGTIQEIEGNKVKIKLDERTVELDKKHLIVK